MHIFLQLRFSFHCGLCAFPGCKLQLRKGRHNLGWWCSRAQIIINNFGTWRWCNLFTTSLHRAQDVFQICSKYGSKMFSMMFQLWIEDVCKDVSNMLRRCFKYITCTYVSKLLRRNKDVTKMFHTYFKGFASLQIRHRITQLDSRSSKQGLRSANTDAIRSCLSAADPASSSAA